MVTCHSPVQSHGFLPKLAPFTRGGHEGAVKSRTSIRRHRADARCLRCLVLVSCVDRARRDSSSRCRGKSKSSAMHPSNHCFELPYSPLNLLRQTAMRPFFVLLLLVPAIAREADSFCRRVNIA